MAAWSRVQAMPDVSKLTLKGGFQPQNILGRGVASNAPRNAAAPFQADETPRLQVPDRSGSAPGRCAPGDVGSLFTQSATAFKHDDGLIVFVTVLVAGCADAGSQV